MVKNTKQVLGDTLKELLKEKPIDRVTVKELVEKCGYNRQTFYYHFYGVDDLLAWVFEQDANKALPETINSDTVADGWRECVVIYFKYLKDNASTVLNVYQSGKRSYMIDYCHRRHERQLGGYGVCGGFLHSDGHRTDRHVDGKQSGSSSSLYRGAVSEGAGRYH